jgi:hypothetical protein
LSLSSDANCYAWTTHFDNDIIHATLPVLDNALPHDNSCHHNFGANQHVFHDCSVFEHYETISPFTVKGFGKNLSAIAIGRGTVRLEGWNNDNKRHSILLGNVLHIPAAHSNLISSIQLDKAGVVTTLGNKSIQLSVNNKTLISGSIVNDMYRLNLTVLRPNYVPLTDRLAPLSLQSRIGPALAASSSQAPSGFCIA